MLSSRIASGWAVSLALTIGLATTLSSQGGPSVRVLARSIPDTITVLRNGTRVEIARQMVKVALHDGDREMLFNVVMLLDNASGIPWWASQHTRSSAPTFDEFNLPFALYFTGHAAVGFRFAHTLSVREVVGRHRDFASLERSVLEDLRANLKAVMAGDPSRHYVEVDLLKQLGDFLFVSRNTLPARSPDVVAVSRNENLWHLTLKGPNKGFADVTLDDRYKLKNIVFRPAQ